MIVVDDGEEYVLIVVVVVLDLVHADLAFHKPASNGNLSLPANVLATSNGTVGTNQTMMTTSQVKSSQWIELRVTNTPW